MLLKQEADLVFSQGGPLSGKGSNPSGKGREGHPHKFSPEKDQTLKKEFSIMPFKVSFLVVFVQKKMFFFCALQI